MSKRDGRVAILTSDNFFKFCDTKIENLYRMAAALIWLEPDVIGLEVAVNDPLCMCLVNCRANLFKNIQCPAKRKGLFLLEYLAERTAVEIFHDEVSNPTLGSVRETEVRDIYDIRMPQPTGCASLAAKAFDKFRPLHEL